MNQKFERLVTLLRDLFQLDQPDLDFGLYRIMHAKAREVTQFLEKDLLPQVRRAFEQYQPADKAEREKELRDLIAGIQKAGMNPDDSPEVRRRRSELANAVDIGALEDEVFDHLHSFFRRYYSEGDFLTKRVYKPGVYAVPYEGEEVVLHWANKDQYYIKTSEYLRDYAFRLKPDSEANPMRVHFRLADATEGEHGNTKAAENKDRAFILAPAGSSGHDFIEIEKIGGRDELVIKFVYRPPSVDDWDEEAKQSASVAAADKPPPQKALNTSAANAILGVHDSKLTPWTTELAKAHVKQNGEKAEYSRLEGHLARYAARHTFDYFIHKGLDAFLHRELDFYIKNEVMHLDDIESETAPKVEQYLSKVKVIRAIAGKIIAFVAQLEEFQKKLWLKKKFVTCTAWCVRLGAIDERFLVDIARNDSQRSEWVDLYAIDKISASLRGPAYSKPLSVAFLKANPSLMVNTKHFPDEFAAQLLGSFADLDGQTDCTLAHGENFHGLRLMASRYRGRIDCTYIDPPYNTDASAIVYKNGYKSSSWVSLMADRLTASRSLLTASGVLVAAIDDEQQRELSFLMSSVFDGRMLGTICVRANPSGRPIKTGYSVSHEYLLFAGAGAGSGIGRLPPTPEQMARFNQSDEDGAFEWRNLRREGSNSDRSARRALYYPIYLKADRIRVPRMRWNPATEEWVVEEPCQAGEHAVWPTNEEGDEKTWRWEADTVSDSLAQLAVRPDRSGRAYVYYKRRPHEEGVVSVSSWFDAKYSATEHGTAVLKDLFGRNPFSYPKSIHAVIDAVYVAGGAKSSATILDYFGGSGTTAHAVIALNRRDSGFRRCVLVEMGAYFDTVLLPRVLKVSYCPEWSDGKPVLSSIRNTAKGEPRLIKVVYLESYEDALNNLVLHRTSEQDSLLSRPESKPLAEQYMLRYMLDTETKGSPSLLSIQKFTDPTAYTMRIKRPGTDESVTTAVDLLETFNWLIGLAASHVAAPQMFTAAFDRNNEGQLRLKGPRGGRLKPDPDGKWWFRTVTGKAPDGKRVLVIWRKRPGGDTTDGIEQDNLVLDEWFRKQGYSTSDAEYDLIYVNGDNNLGNLRQEEENQEGITEPGWKVRVIEEDFHRLMFDTEGA